MADLVTRLLLNNKQFDSNIKKSRKQVQEFEDMTQKFGQGIKSGFAQIAAIAGVAGGAMATFDKFVNASQTTGDAWAGKVEQMKASVDNFFYALNTGDMTSFSMGLEELRKQAQATYEAFDQLGNVRISYGYLGGKVDAEIAKQRAISMDETLTPEEREKALTQWKKLVEEKKRIATNASEASKDALFKMVSQDTMLDFSDISMKDYDRVLALDLENAIYREEEKDKLAKQYEKYQELIEVEAKEKRKLESKKRRLEHQNKVGTNEYDDIVNKIGEINQAQRKISISYKDAILYNKLLVRIKDEELQKTVAVAREADAMKESVYNTQNQFNRGYKRVTNSVNKASGGSKEDAANEGTIKWYNDEISRLNKELSNTQDKKIAGQLQAKVNELNSEKIRLQLVIDQNAFREIHGELEDKFDANPLNLSPKLSIDLDSVKIPPIEPLIKENDIDFMDKYTDRLYGLSSVMGSVNSIINKGTGNWLEYGMGVTQAITAVISQVAALTAAKKADEAADLAATTSKITNMAAETSAQGVALATQTANEAATSSIKVAMATAEMAAKSAAAFAAIPFAGPALAAAQIASFKTLIATTSIPTFAHGGIVPGGSYVGDLVPAMVNSGEMILNNRQQANLFSLLNNGGGKGQQVVSIGNPKVRGSDIYLSLKNYMKSTGKRL